MSEKKIFTKHQLDTLSAQEVIDKIQKENYSLLNTLGADDLRQEMVPVGIICHYAIRALHTPNSIAKSLKPITPAKYNPTDFPNSKRGLVVGFNHPSLGEIPRLIMLKMQLMGDRPMLFPVNLPWYEALAADYEKYCKVGINITPIITPSTWKKLNLNRNHPMYNAASRLKREFRDIYTNRAIQTVKDGGIIFVATSATRQTTVFKTPAVYNKKADVIPTMSVLALQLYQDPKIKCDFLPVSILPPTGYNSRLNFFKTYQFLPASVMTAEQIRKTYFKTPNPKHLDNFDYDFHLALAKNLPKKFWY